MLYLYTINRLGKLIPCKDVLKWNEWFETADRVLRLTSFADGTKVSTVFLGIDHSFGSELPILWETMIFAASTFAEKFDGEMRRYSSKEDAIEGHELLCQELSVGLMVN